MAGARSVRGTSLTPPRPLLPWPPSEQLGCGRALPLEQAADAFVVLWPVDYSYLHLCRHEDMAAGVSWRTLPNVACFADIVTSSLLTCRMGQAVVGPAT